MFSPQKKIYLGDSVYAEFDGLYISIFTDNGLGAKNLIMLESAVFQELIKYGEKAWPGIVKFTQET